MTDHIDVNEFAQIPTTCLSDAMQGMNNMNAAIKPLHPNAHVAGRALTVQMPAGDNLMVLKGIRALQPGDILVIDAKADTYRAIAGDFVIGMAATMGAVAVVVDGVIRDIKGIQALDIPVFSRGTTVAAGDKSGLGDINIPISCGGVAVHPGDIIVGDADGVIVIPQQQAKQVQQAAQAKLLKDEEREQSISGNREATIAYLDHMIAQSRH